MVWSSCAASWPQLAGAICYMWRRSATFKPGCSSISWTPGLFMTFEKSARQYVQTHENLKPINTSDFCPEAGLQGPTAFHKHHCMGCVRLLPVLKVKHVNTESSALGVHTLHVSTHTWSHTPLRGRRPLRQGNSITLGLLFTSARTHTHTHTHAEALDHLMRAMSHTRTHAHAPRGGQAVPLPETPSCRSTQAACVVALGALPAGHKMDGSTAAPAHGEAAGAGPLHPLGDPHGCTFTCPAPAVDAPPHMCGQPHV